jgi:hypothetical protein
MNDPKATSKLPPIIRAIGYSEQGIVLHVGTDDYSAGEVVACTDFIMDTINTYLTTTIAAYRANKQAKAEANLPGDESTAEPDEAAQSAAEALLSRFAPPAGGLPN